MTINKERIKDYLNQRIKVKTKEGIIQNKNITKDELILEDIMKNHNHSWYEELWERNKGALEDVAIEYRGNRITYGEMFQNMKRYAKSMKKMGLGLGSEIPVCLSNCPEMVYILGAASMIGAKVNLFGEKFDPAYIEEIINNCNSNVLFAEDNSYLKIKDAVKKSKVDKTVMISLRDSLKDDMDPLDKMDMKTGRFDNKVDELKKTDSSILSQREFLDIGKDYNGKIEEHTNIDQDFIITYTSGSTNSKRPKAIVHSSKCYITVARYHNKDLNGGFVLKPYKFLAHIPTYSNSNILSIVSDCLMQGATLALEPIYDINVFPESLKAHNPHYVAATKSYWIDTAKKILISPEWVGSKLDNLFLAFSCGEPLERNEEKFINKALKQVKAGVNVTHTPFPIVRLSEAGGDCEHGSIFYTLFRSYSAQLPENKKNQRSAGLGTFPFVEAAILDENGKKLGKNKIGKVVANSPCTMKYYKNDEKATNNFFIKDAEGKTWADLKVYGFIDSYNKLHMLGRMPKEKEALPTFVIAKEILKDTKNILSCEVIEAAPGEYVAHIELQPFSSKKASEVIFGAHNRCNKLLEPLGLKIAYRLRNFKEAFPLNGSGKRDVPKLVQEGITEKCKVPVETLEGATLVTYRNETNQKKKVMSI